MSRNLVLSALLILGNLLISCRSEPEIVEVTRIVTQSETITEQVEVTRIVTGAETAAEQVEVTGNVTSAEFSTEQVEVTGNVIENPTEQVDESSAVDTKAPTKEVEVIRVVESEVPAKEEEGTTPGQSAIEAAEPKPAASEASIAEDAPEPLAGSISESSVNICSYDGAPVETLFVFASSTEPGAYERCRDAKSKGNLFLALEPNVRDLNDSSSLGYQIWDLIAVACGVKPKALSVTFTSPDQKIHNEKVDTLVNEFGVYSNYKLLYGVPDDSFTVSFDSVSGEPIAHINIARARRPMIALSANSGGDRTTVLLWDFNQNEMVRLLFYTVGYKDYELAAWQDIQVDLSGDAVVKIDPSFLGGQFKILALRESGEKIYEYRGTSGRMTVESDSTITSSALLNTPAEVILEPGAESTSINSQIEANDIHSYVLNAQEGQQLNVEIFSPNNDVRFGVSSNNSHLKRSSEEGGFDKTVIKSGEYVITAVSANNPTKYRLDITLSTPGDPTPERPTLTPVSPALTPKSPTRTPEGPTLTPESQTLSPEGPTLTPDSPAPTPDSPAPILETADNIDTDADGLSDEEELTTYFTDLNNPDSDGDGLDDGDEVHGSPSTNPNHPDSDGDGLEDGVEVAMRQAGDSCLSPRNHDSDGDGYSDGEDRAPCDRPTPTSTVSRSSPSRPASTPSPTRTP